MRKDDPLHFVLGFSEQCVKVNFHPDPCQFFFDWHRKGEIDYTRMVHAEAIEHVHKSLDTTDDAVTVSNLCCNTIYLV